MGPFWGVFLSVEYWTLCLFFSSIFTAQKKTYFQFTCVPNIMQHNNKKQASGM